MSSTDKEYFKNVYVPIFFLFLLNSFSLQKTDTVKN